MENVTKNKSKNVPIIAGGVLLILLLVGSFLLGTTTHSEKRYMKDSLANQHKMMDTKTNFKPTKNGAISNYGSISLNATIKLITGNGIVVSTEGGNEVSILVNDKTVTISSSGKKIAISSLKITDKVTVIARVNSSGQFIAIRLTKQ